MAYLKKLVFDFKEAMPIVEALDNPNLAEDHWAEIKAVMKQEEYPLEEKKFTLGELVNFDVADQADEIVNISTTATQENILRSQIVKLQEKWQRLDFDVEGRGDGGAFKILNFEFIQNELDDSMQISSSIVGSRYVLRLQQEANDLHDKFLLIFETLEQWRDCQRQWLYLENIFSSEHIRKDRDTEKGWQEYTAISARWVKIMAQTKQKPTVRYQVSLRENNKERRKAFKEWNEQMEGIQKNLEEYLERKRASFPRFYFISNDELLLILSKQTDLKAIEK